MTAGFPIIDSNKTIGESPNPADERRAQLVALLPEAFSESRLDVATLKRALGEEAVIEGGERYALSELIYFAGSTLLSVRVTARCAQISCSSRCC